MEGNDFPTLAMLVAMSEVTRSFDRVVELSEPMIVSLPVRKSALVWKQMFMPHSQSGGMSDLSTVYRNAVRALHAFGDELSTFSGQIDVPVLRAEIFRQISMLDIKREAIERSGRAA